MEEDEILQIEHICEEIFSTDNIEEFITNLTENIMSSQIITKKLKNFIKIPNFSPNVYEMCNKSQVSSLN